MPSAMPLFASERRAAQLLDMTPGQFRELVDAGALPPPCALAGTVRRWDVEELRAIMRGEKPRMTQELDL